MSGRVAWPLRPLGDLLQIKHGYAFSGEYFTGAGHYVLLTPGNFYEEGGFRSKGDKEKYYVGNVPDGYVLNQGDVIVAMTEQAEGLLGSSAIIPESGRYLHNQRLGLVTVRNDDEIDKRYLYCLFNTKHVRDQIRASATGTKVRHTAPSRIYEVKAPIPPLRVQRSVADILLAYDVLIENNTRRIAILEEMARALYREWFVEFRFPGHEGVRMVESAVGAIPEGWEVTSVGEVADINHAVIRSGRIPEFIDYIDISSVSTGRVDKTERLRFRDAPNRARRIVSHGDVIWSTVRPNRRSYSLILNPGPDTIVSTGFAVLTARRVPFTYLFQATTTDEFAEYLTNRATGSAYPAVTGADFATAPLVLPPAELLNAYHGIAVDNLELKHALTLKNRILSLTRDLLLPKLVAGEIDVSEAMVGLAASDGNE